VSVAAVSESQSSDRPRSPLSAEQRAQMRFVLELVDKLAADQGFDPSDLRSPQTGKPLGPALERIRAELESHEREDAGEGPSPRPD
jgi:hypothetical protein